MQCTHAAIYLTVYSNGRMPCTSKIWDHFTVCPEDSNRAKCNLCCSIISGGGKTASTCNTSNLKSHLKCCHGVVYQTYEAAEKEANAQKRKSAEERAAAGQSTSQNVKRVHQMQLTTMVDNMIKRRPNDQRTIAANSKLAETIALDLQPFSITSNVGIQRFCNLLEPRYNLPSNKHINQTLIPDMYERVKIKVKQELKNVDHVASPQIYGLTNSLLSLTGH